MIPSPMQVTSPVLWRGIFIAAPIDIVFVFLLVSRLRFSPLRQIKWLVTATTAIFFAVMWAAVASGAFWDSVYHYLFPAWMRWWLPLIYGAGFGAAGLVSWSVALRLRGKAVVNFCVLMGLWGMAGHVWAVYRGLMEKPPMLRGASSEAAVVFSGFEFVFYAGVILTITDLFNRIWHRLRNRPR